MQGETSGSWVRQWFLRYDPKTRNRKKMDFIKIKNICVTKETL